jgi:serine/threonine protein kinase
MSPDQEHRLEEIFNAARDLPPRERTTFLDSACGGDAELRRQADSLLAAHEQVGQFLQPTVVLPTPSAPVEKPGDRIGRYKLLEQIGEGGFGVVWMAEQEEPVRRRVALKIIKLGMDTKEVVARFEAERQALAMMDHANIASVFDGGAAETGRPYFVMELVKGVPITDYCDANKLSTRERLELFMQVCQAVQHAHQKGVIHRDLKPSNILVTVQDDRPVPKVIDFGIAKATQARLTEKTLFTRLQQRIGTPAYMSPEQAGLGSLDVDTRSDIYSLGVLLYELLTGRTPFDTQKLLAAGYDAVMRTIREEEPPKPSTRLSTLAEEELNAVAAKRQADPTKLHRLVRGDLDWIVMKALEKERQRRYDTAIGLAGDLERYLKNEPVIAAPPSRLYRIRRFLLRNKLAAGFTAALVVSSMGGTVLSAWQAWRAGRFAREADGQRLVATNETAKATAALAESEQAWKRERAIAYANSMALAYRELLNGDETLARRVLDGCAPELRGWEWHHLHRLANSALWTSKANAQSANPDLISGMRVRFTPDGRLLAVFGFTVRPALFDTRTGQKIFEPTNASGSGFSADGRWLVENGRRIESISTGAPGQAQDAAQVGKGLLRSESEWISITSERDGEVQMTGVPVDLLPLNESTGHEDLISPQDINEALGGRFDEADCFTDEWEGRMALWVARSEPVRNIGSSGKLGSRDCRMVVFCA